MCHLPGSTNQTSDFSSRHPIECPEASCQICKFVNEAVNSVVQSVTLSDILSGATPMPFMNVSAWQSAQGDCPTLRRAYSHLTQGTRPSRKSRNLRDLRLYLNVGCLDVNGLLVVYKQDPFFHRQKLVIVPAQILTALHIYLDHPTTHQLTQVLQPYFYAIKSDDSKDRK